MIPSYAKVLLAAYAKKMRDVIHEVQANETDDIVIHKLAEVSADCAWCEVCDSHGSWKETEVEAAKDWNRRNEK